ncbi:MAG TPA: cupin domain-containing protein [Actinocrinis sp.]|uniref:JmjC domain-containing protein n=1 Tax=Actinocrinis sp. TaxID=1920516 RepID=UPI002DDCDDE1|nr:cupin domain-containing protein [Actinocrinis sp.]HEV2344907.1 cupin domain-containing protein [Actinocrinis sp.]
MFPLGEIGREEFTRDYWRARPLFVKGGARALGLVVDEPEYRAATAALSRTHPHLVRHTSDRFIRAQNVDLGSPRLLAFAQGVAREMGWPMVWFDGVLADHQDSIGCHSDASDNFILQQSGTKVWKLAPPDGLSPETRRQMLLNQPTPPPPLPEQYTEYVLEPGDLLYVPMFWLHWGVSSGPSLSVSLVANPENGLGLLPFLFWALAEDPRWWNPLPAFAPSADDRALADGLFDRLFDAFRDDALKERVKRDWWESRWKRLAPDLEPAR